MLRSICFWQHLSSACLASLLLCSPLPASASEPRGLEVGVQISGKVLLQGAYDSKTGLMRDQLRAKSYLPLTQPYHLAPFNYAGTESMNRALSAISIGGNADAVVDWILIELYSAADNQLRARKALLVQRDGDWMDANTGETIHSFPQLAAGNYHIAVRHRNHLAVKTAQAQALSFTPTPLDFSSTNLAVSGAHSRYLQANKALLWAGDANQDASVLLAGNGNDINAVLATILLALPNQNASSNYQRFGYWATDTNLDGAIIYAGPTNEVDVMFGTVLLHPANTNAANNFRVPGLALSP